MFIEFIYTSKVLDVIYRWGVRNKSIRSKSIGSKSIGSNSCFTLQILECHRLDGFEVGNADKIFESTSANQICQKVA